MFSFDPADFPQASQRARLYNYLFSLLLLIGGLIGYFKTGSWVSGVSGLAAALLIALGSKWSQQNTLGLYLANLTAVGLVFLFITRMLESGKLMPGLPIVVLSVGAVLFNTYVLHLDSLRNPPPPEPPEPSNT